MAINSNKTLLILDNEPKEHQETRLLQNVLTKFFETNDSGYNDGEIIEIIKTILRQQDKNQSFDLLEVLIRKQSQPRVACLLAFCYHYGIFGATLNYDQAFAHYKYAADKDDPYGLNQAGWFFQNGLGVDKDEHQCFQYYKKSAILGDSWGLLNMGVCYTDEIGVEEDLELAFDYFSQASIIGNMCAQDWLAAAYSDGLGVQQDSRKAAYWWKKSADAGYELAQRRLAIRYKKGRGTMVDLHQAFRYWYKVYKYGEQRVSLHDLIMQ